MSLTFFLSKIEAFIHPARRGWLPTTFSWVPLSRKRDTSPRSRPLPESAVFSNWLMQVNKGLIPLPQFRITLRDHCSQCQITWGFCKHFIRAQNSLYPFLLPSLSQVLILGHSPINVHKFLSEIYFLGNWTCDDICICAYTESECKIISQHEYWW